MEWHSSQKALPQIRVALQPLSCLNRYLTSRSDCSNPGWSYMGVAVLIGREVEKWPELDCPDSYQLVKADIMGGCVHCLQCQSTLRIRSYGPCRMHTLWLVALRLASVRSAASGVQHS